MQCIVLFIQGKSHGLQVASHLGDKCWGIETAGKGHVITISGIGDFPFPAPAFHIFIKRPHYQIGYGGRCRGPLREPLLTAAKAGKEHRRRRRKKSVGKRRAVYPGKQDAVEKMADIQLQYLIFTQMNRCICPDIRPLAVSQRRGIPAFHRAHGAEYSSALPLKDRREPEAAGCLPLFWLLSPGGNFLCPGYSGYTGRPAVFPGSFSPRRGSGGGTG